MEAICKPDFTGRTEAQKAAERELADLRKELERSRAKDREGPLSRRTQRLEKRVGGFSIPGNGFHEVYGVWFAGSLVEALRVIAVERFGVDLEDATHAYMDAPPEDLTAGNHHLTVYGHRCRLYKWKAQGFHRGLVVLAGNALECAAANVYMASGTWSWRLGREEELNLPARFRGWLP
ncbi:MAG: hypothetical protein P1P84_08730 [Deferrisomatales bacterium]|nr:hypothetical protein [Deferrisomatales bacterium]